MKVKIKRTDETIPLPQYHTNGSVAFDFSASEKTIIPPKQLAKIPTGLIIAAPPGYGLITAGRSSLAYKKGLMLSNGIGIIDTDYCGEEDKIYISVFNFTDQEAVIEKGERIAQGIFIKIEKAEWEETDKMNVNSRGGWGSTGK